MHEDFYPVIQSDIPARLRLVKALSADFVTSDEVKAQARVLTSDEDTYIQSLISVAISHVEKATGQSFRQNRFIYSLDQFPKRHKAGADEIILPYGPTLAVESITYIDANGAQQTLAVDQYRAELNVTAGRLSPADRWPAVSRRPGCVQITYKAGGAANETAPGEEPNIANGNSIPKPVKQAVIMLASQWHRHRLPIVTGTIVSDMPYAIEALLSPYKVWA